MERQADDVLDTLPAGSPLGVVVTFLDGLTVKSGTGIRQHMLEAYSALREAVARDANHRTQLEAWREWCDELVVGLPPGTDEEKRAFVLAHLRQQDADLRTQLAEATARAERLWERLAAAREDGWQDGYRAGQCHTAQGLAPQGEAEGPPEGWTECEPVDDEIIRLCCTAQRSRIVTVDAKRHVAVLAVGSESPGHWAPAAVVSYALAEAGRREPHQGSGTAEPVGENHCDCEAPDCDKPAAFFVWAKGFESRDALCKEHADEACRAGIGGSAPIEPTPTPPGGQSEACPECGNGSGFLVAYEGGDPYVEACGTCRGGTPEKGGPST
jgi:hypothetical protein